MQIKMIKKILLFILVICFHSEVLASQGHLEETSRLILFLGRFHPLILHLPIGALIITFYLDIVGRLRKNYPKKTISMALGFSSFFAILACVLGYFLSLEGGYDKTSIDIHFWTGILAAFLITLLYLMTKSTLKRIRQSFFLVFVLTMTSLSIAGHYGSVLTHGDNFITEYAIAPPEQRTVTVIDSLKIYDDVIHKILDDKCIQCHNSTKKKGDLSLISKAAILKGGENGEIVHPNDAMNSTLYVNALLPLSDDLHMPPEGKPQLTKNELWLLNYWINNNLDFSSKVAQFKNNDSLNKLLKNYLVFEKINIPFASQSDILDIKNAGFRVDRIVPNQPELILKYLGTDLKKGDLKLLASIKSQIVALDLSNSTLTDKMTTALKKLKRLKKIRLDNTLITDKTLGNIESLEHLEVLNIHNTEITNTGLEKLLEHIKPEYIYSWNTKVENDFATALAKKHELTISNGVFEGFVEKTALKTPTLLTKKTLFVDTISIKLQTKMKGVAIRYTLNGEDPDENSLLYSIPIVLNANATIKAKAFKKEWYPSETLSKDYTKAGIKINNYTIAQEPDQRYPKSSKLFDFEEGTDNFRDGKWTGFNGNDLVTELDLGEELSVENVSVNCLENFKDYILFPKKILVYSTDRKGAKYKKLGELKIKSHGVGSIGVIKRFTLKFPETKAQFLKIVVENSRILPPSHAAAGEKSWMFVDEITVQ